MNLNENDDELLMTMMLLQRSMTDFTKKLKLGWKVSFHVFFALLITFLLFFFFNVIIISRKCIAFLEFRYVFTSKCLIKFFCEKRSKLGVGRIKARLGSSSAWY